MYESVEEQIATAAAYLADGLARNEQCLYSADTEEALDRFRGALSALGFDTAALETRGALMLRTKAATHLSGGRFDCERMLRMLNDAVEAALNAGFAALRTCGDMSWLLDDAPGTSQVVEYEGLLNQFFGNVRALGMCQYDQNRLPEGLLDQALANHTSVVIDRRHTANPFYRPWPFAQEDRQRGGAASSKIQQLRTVPVG